MILLLLIFCSEKKTICLSPVLQNSKMNANLLSEEEENERIMLGFMREEDGDDGNNDDASE